MEKLQQLPAVLLPWYYVNQRTLPWRQDREPYHVWLSEIMLQQTRVEAVKGYYTRFLEALPTIAHLARCDDDVLHKLWEGLGYYSRVRNLKKAAQVIMERFGGVFPQTYEQILALPGIGEYTAGAIASICFDAKTPAVDGNVLRVMTRLTEDATPIDSPSYKRLVRETLAGIYPSAAGDFTQALMELGATVCGPNRKPDCESCPCRQLCGGALHNTAEGFPVKGEKKSRKVEQLSVFILSCQGRYALGKRPNQGLLAGLWQFPNVHGHLDVPQALEAVQAMGVQPMEVLRQLERSHIFTHIRWEMRGLFLEVRDCSGDFSWLTEEEILTQAALPTAFRQFWEERHDI